MTSCVPGAPCVCWSYMPRCSDKNPVSTPLFVSAATLDRRIPQQLCESPLRLCWQVITSCKSDGACLPESGEAECLPQVFKHRLLHGRRCLF